MSRLHQRDELRRGAEKPGEIGEAEDNTVQRFVEVEAGPAEHASTQSRPEEFSSTAIEVVAILVCSVGQLFFAMLLGNIEVNQEKLLDVLGIAQANTPWLLGSFLLANGVSVSVCGSLTDLVPPRRLMISAFAWMAIWNFIGAFIMQTSHRWALFHVVRTMQGLALGPLVSGPMSILGRLYKPGKRKTRAFSLMAIFPPLGMSVGGVQGGALTNHIGWIFGSNAILSGVCAVAAFVAIPSLRPAKIAGATREVSLKDLDIAGAVCLIFANTLLLFGVTQGSATNWSPYTYVLAIIGAILLVVFYFLERVAGRPLIPPQLWNTKGFTPLMLAFGMSYGSWIGAWQFFAFQYFLFYKKVTPLTAGCYFIPNALVGVLAVFVVQSTLHRFASHWIFAVSMLANGLAPAFFIPVTSTTIYWSLPMLGIALGTFGPDMSFAAASIFITSSVPKSYQGAAGSLLITIENLSSAVFVVIAGAIGVAVDGEKHDVGSQEGPGLKGLHASWWFATAVSVVAAFITVVAVRIQKAEEDDHVPEEST